MVPINQGFSDLTTAVNALSTEGTAVVSAINALIAQVAAGSPVSGDQLEALAAQVSGVNSQLASAIAPPAGTSTATSTATSS